MTSEDQERSYIPGGHLLHPIIIVCLALWILNDHVFKAAWPSAFTGKLSDVVSLVVFPLLMLAIVEACWQRVSGTLLPRLWYRRVLFVAIASTGLVMLTINCLDSAAYVYRWGLGSLQWVAYSAWAWVQGASIPSVAPVRLWMDPTDALTLPALLVPLWLGTRLRDGAAFTLHAEPVTS